MGMTLRADRDELRRFVSCLFPYADSDTFAALRGFDQFRRDVPPPVMGSVRINGDLNALVEQAWRAAQRCANAAAPIVFAPPICTFSVAKSARGGDLADGLVLSVELDDGATLVACAKLERLLGPCTVVVASGGDAVDPLTGELSPKLHLHWRLSEPTRDAAEHAKLRLARDLACRLAGGDPTGKSVVHPLRWPGSWNCKAEPRMARITAENPQAEIHLNEALERLEEAVEAAGLEQIGVPRSGDPQSSPALVASAMATIPNAGTEVHYDTWIRLGYGCFRAAGGADWGRDAWEAWSKKSDKFDAGEQDAAWARIGKAVTAAPAKVTIGAGTIFFMAAKAGWTRPRPQRAEYPPPPPPSEPPPMDEPPPGDEPGPRRRPARNTRALVAFIQAAEDWAGNLAWNELTETIEISVTFPARSGRRPLSDADLLEAMIAFQGAGFPKCSKGMALEAIRAVAERHAYHPIRNRLNDLQWDGVPRIHTLFSEYFGADPDGQDICYLEHVARCWMVSAVARVMQPGCKADHAPILVGKQRMGKSTAVARLCHDPAWFTDDISPNLLDRDTKESLRGKWIVELAEIPQLRREADKVKAFFTRQSDRYREAYGLLNQDHPRQCVFIGTTNELQFVDHTGNRRFWPVKLKGPIDVARIDADRDQLWAEAVALYRQDEKWWLPPDVEDMAAERQEEFAETDVWDELILRWRGERQEPFALTELFAAIMPDRLHAGLATKAEQMRAAQCLVRIGFVKVQRMINGKKTKWWQKPPAT